MERYEALAGSMIFKEGDPSDCACVIVSGNVQILKRAEHGEVELAVLGEGELFGEMGLLEPGGNRSASVRALDHVVVERIGADDLQAMMEAAHPLLTNFMSATVKRLRIMNRRLAEKERATVLLGHHINDIHLMVAPGAALTLEPQHIKTANLPFLIGGYPSHESPPQRSHVEIACEREPANVSYEHCTIERMADGVYVVDKGSRFKTILNDSYIGRGEVTNKALLMPGENSLILGHPNERMRLILQCT